jgi:hypothetical protein
MRDASRLRIPADKKEIKDFPKLPLAASFIHKTLYEISTPVMEAINGD